MNLKEFISALFEKWACKHDWENFVKVDVWGESEKYPKYHILHFKCKKCGAIRKNKVADDDNMDLVINLSVAK